MTRKQKLALALLLFAALLLVFTLVYTSSWSSSWGFSSPPQQPRESLRLIVEPSGVSEAGVAP